MKLLLLSIFVTLYTSGAVAQNTQYCSKEGVAIKGYDPVAYFIQHEALEGKDNFSTEWSGSTWKFISQANLDSFKVAPQKYAPQYGGYCAYGLSENHKSPSDPMAWTIVGQKLYLNYNPKVKQMWQKDTIARIKTADQNWPAVNQ